MVVYRFGVCDFVGFRSLRCLVVYRFGVLWSLRVYSLFFLGFTGFESLRFMAFGGLQFLGFRREWRWGFMRLRCSQGLGDYDDLRVFFSLRD